MRPPAGLDEVQWKNARQMLRIAERERANRKAKLALIEAGLVESGLRNLRHGDRDSIGILQIRVGLHGAETARSIRRSTEAFLRKGFTGHGGAISLSQNERLSSGEVAQLVQGSAYPLRYTAERKRANTIVDAYDRWKVNH